MFAKITDQNESKILRYHVNVNVSLMVESEIQIKSVITIKGDMRAKNIIYVKITKSGILLHVVTKMVNI